MTWVKLDDGFPRHPKVLRLSADVKWSYVEALCYSAQYLTDGKFPAGLVPDEHVAALVECGLVDDRNDAYAIHDYLEYNPSRRSVQSKSKANRNAARKRWADVVQSESHAERMQDALVDGTGRGGSEQNKVSDFEAFWLVYPRRVGKIRARQEWDALIDNGVDPADLIAAAERYRDDTARTPTYTAHPSTWLHQGRWLDEAAETEADRTLKLIRERRKDVG